MKWRIPGRKRASACAQFPTRVRPTCALLRNERPRGAKPPTRRQSDIRPKAWLCRDGAIRPEQAKLTPTTGSAFTTDAALAVPRPRSARPPTNQPRPPSRASRTSGSPSAAAHPAPPFPCPRRTPRPLPRQSEARPAPRDPAVSPDRASAHPVAPAASPAACVPSSSNDRRRFPRAAADGGAPLPAMTVVRRSILGNLRQGSVADRGESASATR